MSGLSLTNAIIWTCSLSYHFLQNLLLLTELQKISVKSRRVCNSLVTLGVMGNYFGTMVEEEEDSATYRAALSPSIMYTFKDGRHNIWLNDGAGGRWFFLPGREPTCDMLNTNYSPIGLWIMRHFEFRCNGHCTEESHAAIDQR